MNIFPIVIWHLYKHWYQATSPGWTIICYIVSFRYRSTNRLLRQNTHIRKKKHAIDYTPAKSTCQWEVKAKCPKAVSNCTSSPFAFLLAWTDESAKILDDIIIIIIAPMATIIIDLPAYAGVPLCPCVYFSLGRKLARVWYMTGFRVKVTSLFPAKKVGGGGKANSLMDHHYLMIPVNLYSSTIMLL